MLKKNVKCQAHSERNNFIVWDEVVMANKAGMKAFDRTLWDLRNDDCSMRDVVILFTGYFSQILLVIPRGT